MQKKWFWEIILIGIIISGVSFCELNAEILHLKLKTDKKISGDFLYMDTESITLCYAWKLGKPTFCETFSFSEIEHIEGKKPETAFLLALGPGFFLHGLGSAYAENSLLAGILAGCGTSIIFLLPFPPYGTYPPPEIRTLITCLFWVSWAADIIVSPLLSMDYNRKLKRLNLPVKISLDQKINDIYISAKIEF
ncbi:hypothetical protein AUJ66_05525 [Candidatus Desantisbacteria bacterium CG1_02_38_46]|uniref:Uncharacterized protein n=3 Tax=unclassified Candidatus Desantisiibacteriota TaxID=3106372 RepID=A0A2H9PAR6_9BACT|nr:MAG: hypothetical protein AUJ66_05525 [Candidatus Desantisbacteria bacterium CG1_02_38_46]PIU51989.1 MAG: hypothetical protein COS91_01620 [Candidatus Desantisbacteria bacterium CG07_land_8_20_14_0_80_39_15]PIZ15620.1 MAG: hypothetical protein COY51_04830 [Candidatus Desantisbacteria bacterium CG_4_10_14_0_8_um_filter_39_17]